LTVADQTRKYKQPRRINAVSVVLGILLVSAGYVAFSSWPVFGLSSDVKNELDDALPRLYRANLLPEPEATIGAEEIRRSLIERLTTLGIANPESALTIARDTRVVTIGVDFTTAIDLHLIGKKIPVNLHPRAETSAERVSF
jgi:hypothetical protein